MRTSKHLDLRLVLSGFIICLMIMSPATISSAELAVDELGFEVSEFSEDIVAKLIADVTYENNTFKGWKWKINNTANPFDLIFKGYQVGIAGISDVLLNQQKYEGLDKEAIYTIVNDCVDLFANQTLEEDVGISWYQLVDYPSNKYIGQRYGPMGFLKFLAHVLYESDVDTSYPEINTTKITWMIDNGIAWIMDLQMDDGGWEIAPRDYISTGWEYGVAGVGQGFLDIYQYIENDTYVEIAEEAGNWLTKVGKWEDEQYILPWTSLGDEGAQFGFDEDYASLGAGVAGVMDYLLNLYEITSNTTYLEYATGIAKRLIALEDDGSFPRNTVHYLTELSEGPGETGFLTGSSGVAYALLRYYDITEDEKVLPVNYRVDRYLQSLFYSNGSLSYSADLPEAHYNGYSMGVAGIAKYYIDQYQRFGNPLHLSIIHQIFNGLKDKWDTYGMIPISNRISFHGFSYNINDGLAGILQVLRLYENIDFDSIPDYSETSYPDDTNGQTTPLGIEFMTSLFLVPVVARKWISRRRKLD